MERPSYRGRIERIFDHCADTRSLFVRTLRGRLPQYSPGMFISITIPLANEIRTRPYTIVTSPEDGEPFELCFNLIPNGPGSAWMYERKVGDLLDFTGPFGAFTLEHAADREIVFIAEGTAIAPIRPMLHRALAQCSNHPVYLLYAANRIEHLLYRPELDSLSEANPQFGFQSLVIEHASLHQRLRDEVQRRWVESDNDRSRHFFVCGIGSGVLKLRDLLRQAGYERRAVHYEQW
jgi:CDP-4-dehydro-6-deoxyglucose reductase, E3